MVSQKHGDVLVGTAVPATLDMNIPLAPSLEHPIAGRNAYPENMERNFNSCFVCGPNREKGDGMRLFTGPVDGLELLACDWQPDASLVDSQGIVATEFV